MLDPIQILSVGTSLGLLLLVLELVRRRLLGEEFSLLWLGSATLLLIISVWRELFIDRLALWLGIHYPPALLLLALVFVVFIATLFFSVVVSRQRQQIRDLAEEVALLDARLRNVEAPDRASGSGERGGELPDSDDESPAGSPEG